MACSGWLTSLRPRRFAADRFSVGRSRRGSRTARCSCPRKKSVPVLGIWLLPDHGGGGEGEWAAARAFDCGGPSADEQCRFRCTWRFAVICLGRTLSGFPGEAFSVNAETVAQPMNGPSSNHFRLCVDSLYSVHEPDLFFLCSKCITSCSKNSISSMSPVKRNFCAICSRVSVHPQDFQRIFHRPAAFLEWSADSPDAGAGADALSRASGPAGGRWR